jgi:hypothetical protein
MDLGTDTVSPPNFLSNHGFGKAKYTLLGLTLFRLLRPKISDCHILHGTSCCKSLASSFLGARGYDLRHGNLWSFLLRVAIARTTCPHKDRLLLSQAASPAGPFRGRIFRFHASFTNRHYTSHRMLASVLEQSSPAPKSAACFRQPVMTPLTPDRLGSSLLNNVLASGVDRFFQLTLVSSAFSVSAPDTSSRETPSNFHGPCAPGNQ